MSPLDLFKSMAASDPRDAFISESPWKAKTALAAGMATLAGMTGWISDIASPALARFGGSYTAGGFIGWAFRRFIRLVLVIGAFTLAGMAVMKHVGWFTADWVTLERHITRNFAVIRHGAEGVKQFLTSYCRQLALRPTARFWGSEKNE